MWIDQPPKDLRVEVRCSRALSEPGVPGTRGMRIGARRAPDLISKSESEGNGIFESPASERGVYARIEEGRRGMLRARSAGREKGFMVRWGHGRRGGMGVGRAGRNREGTILGQERAGVGLGVGEEGRLRS